MVLELLANICHFELPEGSSSGYFTVYLAHFQSEVREYQTIAIASMGQ